MAMKNSFELIYDVVRRIPYGKVATYGQIAMLAGNPHLMAADLARYFGGTIDIIFSGIE